MTTIWAKMPYRSYRVSGSDAVSFLQGQLTQDIKKLTIERGYYSGYCNPQGRLLACLLLSLDESGAVVMRLHETLAESVIQRLKLFILRSEVSIDIIEQNHIALNKMAATALCEYLGQRLPSIFEQLTLTAMKLFALPNDLFELHTADKKIVDWIHQKFKQNEYDIHQQHLLGGHFHILPKTNEYLLPQQTSLAMWGGISYTKGCYVGQEIIARNKYLGKVKKGFATTTLIGQHEILVGDEITCQKRAVGRVIEVASSEDHCCFLALLSLDKIAETCLLGEIEIPLIRVFPNNVD